MGRNIEEITVGMPVTVSIGSDCYPYEVVEVRGSRAVIRECEPVNCAPWTSGCRTDEYRSMLNGSTMTLSSQGSHGWHVLGESWRRPYGFVHRVSFGRAHYYQDPSF